MAVSYKLFLSFLVFLALIGAARASVAPQPPSPFLSSLPQAEASRVLTHPHLLTEAELYLSTCQFQKTKGELRLCRLNQADFVVDYIDAFYNHISAQENLSFLFSGAQGSSDDLLGLRPSKIQGCAWALATINSGGPMVGAADEVDVKSDCDRLPVSSMAAANARASVLVAEIHAHIFSGTHGITVADKFP